MTPATTPSEAPTIVAGSTSLGERLRRLRRWWPVPLALGAATSFWLGQQWGAGVLDGRHAEVAGRIATFENAIATGRRQRSERPKIDSRLDELAARMLGSDLETADSSLRSRLNRLGEESGLAASLVVSTQSPTTRGTPARSEFSRSATQRALRDEPDFVEVPASVSVQGPLDSVLRLAHRIDQEPWLKRIDSMRLERAPDGRMKLDLRLTTVFVPGLVASEGAEPVIEATPFDRYALLLADDPFATPTPAAPEPRVKRPRDAAPAPPPPPAEFPYAQWFVTGMVEGPSGPEVWLRNAGSGETRTLLPSQRLGDAELLGIQGDRAQFRLGEESFVVLVGSTLGDRYPQRQ